MLTFIKAMSNYWFSISLYVILVRLTETEPLSMNLAIGAAIVSFVIGLICAALETD